MSLPSSVPSQSPVVPCRTLRLSTISLDDPAQFRLSAGPRRAETLAKIGIRTLETICWHHFPPVTNGRNSAPSNT